jgi:hypothetical protein
MRRLAPGARHRRSRRQDGPSDGLDDVKNGALLTLASQHFDVFVTVDRNLSFQQNLVDFSLAVVVLQAKTNRLADLRPLIPRLLVAIGAATPGMTKFIGADGIGVARNGAAWVLAFPMLLALRKGGLLVQLSSAAKAGHPVRRGIPSPSLLLWNTRRIRPVKPCDDGLA